MTNKEVWIGLIDCVALSDNNILDGARSAAVNILALASDEAEYCKEVRKALNDFGLGLKSIEDAEPISNRLIRYTIADELLKLAEEVTSAGGVRFGTFHTYENET